MRPVTMTIARLVTCSATYLPTPLKQVVRLRGYLLAWSGEAELEEGWNQSLADAEWAAIKVASRKVSDEPVLAIEEIRLEAVGFSAALA